LRPIYPVDNHEEEIRRINEILDYFVEQGSVVAQVVVYGTSSETAKVTWKKEGF